MERKNSAIQLYKGIAIIFIALTHFSQLFVFNVKIFSDIPKIGQMFTSVFFVLSCFGLCISYSKNKPTYFEFLKKRISKLFVGYYLMILVYLFIRVFISRTGSSLIESINPIGIILNVLFLNGFANSMTNMNMIVYGGWFIGAIVVFYVLFPFLYKFLVDKNGKVIKSKIKLIFALEIIIDLLFIIVGKIDGNLFCSNNSLVYFNFLNHLSCFCLGFILFYYYNKNNIKIKKHIIQTVLFLLISIFLFYSGFEYSFLFLPFCFGLFFINLYNATNSFIEKQNNLVKRFILRIGDISWEMYLVHPVFVYFIFMFINGKLINRIPSNHIRYIILLPIFYISTYIASIIFKKIIKSINSIVMKGK